MSQFDKNFEFQSAYLPHIKSILGKQIFKESSFKLDTEEATDLLMLKSVVRADFTVACRVRRSTYVKYWPEFTIRYSKSTGYKTEYEKIHEGYGTWMVYGFADPHIENRLSHWMIIDLELWRLSDRHNVLSYTTHSTPDGTVFRSYQPMLSLPSCNLVINSHPEIRFISRRFGFNYSQEDLKTDTSSFKIIQCPRCNQPTLHAGVCTTCLWWDDSKMSSNHVV